jgi:hypothetical protein
LPAKCGPTVIRCHHGVIWFCAAQAWQQSGRARQRKNCECVKRLGMCVMRRCAEMLNAGLKDIFRILKTDSNNIDSLVPTPEK